MRKKILTRVLSVLLTIALGVSLAACGSSGDTSEADNTTQKSDKEPFVSDLTGIPLTSSDVTIVLGEQGYREIPIILNQGWFEDVFGPNNIKIDVATFNNGPEMIEAFTAEQLDLGLMGLQPGISGVANDAGTSIIASFCDAPSEIILASLKDSGINSVSDLKGKTVGTTIGSSAYSLLIKLLEEEGLSIDTDINFVNIDFSSAPTALESGEVDAAIGYADAFEQVILQDGDIFNVIKDATGYGISENIIVVRDKIGKEYPDVIENLLALFQKANEFIHENPEQAITINAEYYGIDESVVKNSLEKYDYNWVDQDKLTKDVDGYIQFMFDNDLITTRLKAEDVLDFSYFNDAFGK